MTSCVCVCVCVLCVCTCMHTDIVRLNFLAFHFQTQLRRSWTSHPRLQLLAKKVRFFFSPSGSGYSKTSQVYKKFSNCNCVFCLYSYKLFYRQEGRGLWSMVYGWELLCAQEVPIYSHSRPAGWSCPDARGRPPSWLLSAAGDRLHLGAHCRRDQPLCRALHQ